MSKISKVVESLNREFEKIWLSEPPEVRRLREDKKLAGAFEQKGSLLLYTDAETGEIQLYLFYLKSLVASGELNIDAAGIVLAKMLESKGNQWRRYYGMDETPSLMEEAAVALKTAEKSEDVIAVVDGLLLYLGRLSLWLDQTIPWAGVCSMIDWHVRS